MSISLFFSTSPSLNKKRPSLHERGRKVEQASQPET